MTKVSNQPMGYRTEAEIQKMLDGLRHVETSLIRYDPFDRFIDDGQIVWDIRTYLSELMVNERHKQ